jgi:hypothetical protein
MNTRHIARILHSYDVDVYSAKLFDNLLIIKCAENSTTSDLVRQYGGLDPLINLLTNERIRQNTPLLAATAGAIWKCSCNVENIRRLDELETVALLVQLLANENEEVSYVSIVLYLLAILLLIPFSIRRSSPTRLVPYRNALS